VAPRPTGGKGSNQYQTKGTSGSPRNVNGGLIAGLRDLARRQPGDVDDVLGGADLELVVAQTAAFDAVDALARHGKALTLAGALAVYEHTSDLDLAVATTTNDADFAVDLVLVAGNDPPIGDAMETAGFVLAETSRPGIWTKHIAGMEVTVDLIVPETIAGPGRRGARLGDPHGDNVAGRAAGLELAVDDHELRTLRSLDPTTPRTVRVQVAGPTALLCAKAFKLTERLGNPSRPDRIRAKDAGDMWRLFATTNPDEIRERFDGYENDNRFRDTARLGRRHIADLFTEHGPGTALAIQAFTPSEPEDRVRGTIAAWINKFRD